MVELGRNEKSVRKAISCQYMYNINISTKMFAQLNILSNHDLMNLLLYGNEDLPSDINKCVLEYTINLIYETGRFN